VHLAKNAELAARTMKTEEAKDPTIGFSSSREVGPPDQQIKVEGGGNTMVENKQKIFFPGELPKPMSAPHALSPESTTTYVLNVRSASVDRSSCE
jgi:hypothetical protein